MMSSGILSRRAISAVPMYRLLLLVTSFVHCIAQCTFQGSLARRGEYEDREPFLEDAKLVNRHSARKRTACNVDNVLRALRANSAAATTFCETFINVPTVTASATLPGLTPTV